MTIEIKSLISTIRKQFNISQQELADFLGTSLVSVSRWESGTSSPSPAQAKQIQNLHSQLSYPSSPELSMYQNGISQFASKGIRTKVTSLPLFSHLLPEISLAEQPLAPILSRLKKGAFFSLDAKEVLETLLAQNATPSVTVEKAPTNGMSAGKNTYTYDAHTYHTKVPPQGIAELLKHYLPEGGIVLDPFAGSGMTGVASRVAGCDCILNELSPAACFIADRFTSIIGSDEFEAGVKTVLSELEDLRKRLYMTTCRDCGKSVEFLYMVWSYRAICNHCHYEFQLWNECRSYGKSVKEHKILSRFPCPKCRQVLKKSQLKRTTLSPVMVVYRCCGSEYKRHEVCQGDLDLIEQIEKNIPLADGFYPTLTLPEGVNLGQPKKHGITTIDQFYTTRNLVAMSHLWHTIHRVESVEVAAFLAFAFTSLYQRVTKLSEFRFWGGSGNMARFNVPFISKEANVFDTFARKARTIQDHLESTVAHYNGNRLVVNGSATHMDFLPDHSIDLIFTDPPFGSNINYSEMNILWESWLGEFTNSTDEVIMNKIQKKGLKEYHSLMTKSLSECFRVLRPGHWMLLVFMNSSQKVWEALISSVVTAGFEIYSVDIYDKQHGTFKQYVHENTAGADLVLHCFKPELCRNKHLSNRAANQVKSIEDFLATIDINHYQNQYLHVERQQEIDYRTLYSEWLAQALINQVHIIGFADFRHIVQNQISSMPSAII